MDSDGRANVTISKMFQLLSFIESDGKAKVTDNFYALINLCYNFLATWTQMRRAKVTISEML